jgi:hypothetical protein
MSDGDGLGPIMARSDFPEIDEISKPISKLNCLLIACIIGGLFIVTSTCASQAFSRVSFKVTDWEKLNDSLHAVNTPVSSNTGVKTINALLLWPWDPLISDTTNVFF